MLNNKFTNMPSRNSQCPEIRAISKQITEIQVLKPGVMHTLNDGLISLINAKLTQEISLPSARLEKRPDY